MCTFACCPHQHARLLLFGCRVHFCLVLLFLTLVDKTAQLILASFQDYVISDSVEVRTCEHVGNLGWD